MKKHLLPSAAAFLVGVAAVYIALDPRLWISASGIREVFLSEAVAAYCSKPTNPERYLGAAAFVSRIASRTGTGALVSAEIARCGAAKAKP